MKETKAPDGYVLDSTPKYIAIAKKVGTVGKETYPAELNTLANGTQYTVTYENAGEALTVQGTKETVAKIQNRFRMELILKKINAQGETLPGAVFEIWNGDNLHGTYAVQADGTVNISDLADGEYIIKEKQAPSGYKKRTDSVTIRVTDGQISYAESNTGSTSDWLLGQPNQEKNSCVLTVTNEQLKWLPTAGGRGLLPLTLLSGALIGAGAWILVRMKRSR